jgi:hypothetical protein
VSRRQQKQLRWLRLAIASFTLITLGLNFQANQLWFGHFPYGSLVFPYFYLYLCWLTGSWAISLAKKSGLLTARGQAGTLAQQWRSLLWAGLLSAVLLSTSGVFKTNLGGFATLASKNLQQPYSQLVALQQFAGELYMTNINTPTVGFFTQEAGFGICGLESIGAQGKIDTSQCKVAFMRQHDYYAQQTPRYMFFFRSPEFFPGFADCLPSETLFASERAGEHCLDVMHQRLTEQFPKIYENALFEVFELTHPLEPGSAS